MDESRIRAAIAEHLGVPAEAVSDHALFREDLGADSLDLVQLTMLIENLIDAPVDEDEVLQCPTVGDALRLLKMKMVEEKV